MQQNPVMKELIEKYTQLSEGVVWGDPCKEDQMKEIEKSLGGTLSSSLKDFYSLHNGSHNFIGSMRILSAEDFDSEWYREMEEKKRKIIGAYGIDPKILDDTLLLVVGEDEKYFYLLDKEKQGEEYPIYEFDPVLIENEEGVIMSKEDLKKYLKKYLAFPDFYSFIKKQIEISG